MGEVCSTHGRDKHNILVRQHGRKRKLGRPRRRWEDNIKVVLKEIWWEGVNWMHQWWAVVNTVMNIQVRKKTGNFLIR
jgi:hypothetical protein